MIVFERPAPYHVDRPYPVVHRSVCYRVFVLEALSVLPGEPHIFTVSFERAALGRVHPSFDSLEEARIYAERLLGLVENRTAFPEDCFVCRAVARRDEPGNMFISAFVTGYAAGQTARDVDWVAPTCCPNHANRFRIASETVRKRIAGT